MKLTAYMSFLMACFVLDREYWSNQDKTYKTGYDLISHFTESQRSTSFETIDIFNSPAKLDNLSSQVFLVSFFGKFDLRKITILYIGSCPTPVDHQ